MTVGNSLFVLINVSLRKKRHSRIMMYFAVPRNGPNGVSFGKVSFNSVAMTAAEP